jgi:hypothetical protein
LVIIQVTASKCSDAEILFPRILPMNTTLLLEKLIEIERALGRGDVRAIYPLVMDAEECVLRMQRDFIQSQKSKQHRAA